MATKAEKAGGVASATPEAMDRIMIPLDLIVMDQERERLAEDPELDQLVASMRVDGLLQPVGVLELGRTLKHQKHRLVFGHRRFTAAKRLGWKAIEATIVVLPEGFTENDVLQVRAIENLQRKELNPAEEAVMVAQLLDTLAMEASSNIGLTAKDGGGYRETQNREPNAGVCTFESCFKEKAAASNGAVSRTAMKYNREQAKLAVKDRVEPTPKSVAALVPEFLKPTTIAAAAKDRWADMVQAKKPKSSPATQAAQTKPKKDPAHTEAEEKHRRAYHEWSRTTPKKLINILKGKPLHLLVLHLLEHTDVVTKADMCRGDKRDKALQSPGVLRWINLLASSDISLDDIAAVASSISPERIENDFGCSLGGDTQDGLISQIGIALKVDLAPPKLEDFLPKAEPKKETPAKSPKLTNVRIRETKCTGKCGRTEAQLKKAKVEWATDAKTICDECANGALDGNDA